MKVIVFSALLICVSGLGSDRCTWGPTHWCHSLDNAKSCGAVKHCTDTVWTHTTNLQEDASEVCEFCENIIGDVKKFVASNETEDQVKNYLDAACGIIPVADLAAQCKDAVDTDISELWDLVRADVDPKMICSLIGLCQGFSKQSVKAPTNLLHHVPLNKDANIGVYVAPDTEAPTTVAPTTSAPPPDLCADCKKLINDMGATITDQTTEDQIEQLLREQICSQLGSFAGTCNMVVDSYTPEILQLLASQLDAGLFCEAIGFCPGGDKMCLVRMRLQKSPLFIAMQEATVGTADECVFCKIIIEEVQTEIRDPTVQKNVEEFLEMQLCSKLGSFKDACLSTVSSYGAILFQLVASEMDPQTVCDNMGMCSAKAKTSTAAVIRAAMPQVPQQAMVELTPAKHVQSGSACIICETVLTELKNIIDSNATEEQIAEKLEQICTYLPTAIQAACKDFVGMYGPAVVDLIIQKVDPDTVCKTIGLCSKAALAAVPVKADSVNGDYCGICETVVAYIDSTITQNATEAEIKAELEKACSYLPDTIKETCNSFVEENLATLIDLLMKELTPEEICTELGLCGSKLPKSKPSMFDGPLAETANEYCGICETVIQYLDSILVENATEAQIQADLERVCNFLPDTIKQTCDQLVEQYLDIIVQLVAKALTPEQVCTEIGLCNTNQLKMAAVLREMYAPIMEDIPVFKMDDVPIFNNIPSVEKMEQIVPQKARMLGVDECTFGPSFWCASEDNAKKCRATTHCQEKVWKH